MPNENQEADLATLLTAEQRAELTLLVATATENMREALDHAFDIPPPEERPQPIEKRDNSSDNVAKVDKSSEDLISLDDNSPENIGKKNSSEEVGGITMHDNTSEDSRPGITMHDNSSEESPGISMRDNSLSSGPITMHDDSSQPENQTEDSKTPQDLEEKQPESGVHSPESQKSSSPDSTKEGQSAAPKKLKKSRTDQMPSPKLVELHKKALYSFDTWREEVLMRIGEVVNSSPGSSERKQPEKASVEPAGPPPQPARPDDELAKLYPPIPTPLTDSLKPGAAPMILQAILLLLLSLEHYDARSRNLLLRLTSSLRLPRSILIAQETTTAASLLKAASMSADKESKSRIASSKTAKAWKVGLASIGGAALIGITGGLAAPLVAAGIGSVMSGIGLGATAAAGYLGAVASSGAIVGAMFGAYGARMTGNMVARYAAEVEDFSFIPVRKNPEQRLRVAIGITGTIVSSTDEVVEPWRVLGDGIDGYALRWEVEALKDLGQSLQTILSTAAMTVMGHEIIRRTVFATLYAALWPITLLKIAKVVDNPYNIAKKRSEKAGRVLADALINRAQGERPVTLVGFSLGARVVYACLLELASRGAFGLIENVVLIGAPVPADAKEWRIIRAVASGRVVNVYSEEDFVLAFLYRTSSIQLGVAGLQEIKDVKGVENVDDSDRVSGHLKWRHVVPHVVSELLKGDTDAYEVGRLENVLQGVEEKERIEKELEKAKEGKGEKEDADADREVEEAARRLEAEMDEKRKAREVGKERERRAQGRRVEVRGSR